MFTMTTLVRWGCDSKLIIIAITLEILFGVGEAD